jgi:ABC-type glycerol-3-phosphate transport system substrate-binding protein
MGIEMTWVGRPEPVRAAERRLSEAWPETPVTMSTWNPDSPAAQALDAYVAAVGEAGCAFDVNWSGMGSLLRAMDERGMLSGDGPITTPDVAMAAWLTSQEIDVRSVAGPQELTTTGDHGLTPARTSTTVGQAVGIPRHKLLSNDDWVVTPEECQGALDALGDQPPPDFGDWDGWERWLAFLHGAVTHGGFIVT